MKAIIALFVFLLCGPVSSQIDYNRFFLTSTIRVDYQHSGSKTTEHFALDAMYREGIWPGSRVNLVDTLNLGEYFVKVTDVQTGLLLYSRGYSTVFNEWQTTDEAASGITKSFSESVRFPFPKRPVIVSIHRRNKAMIFEEKASFLIDPHDKALVNSEKRHAQYELVSLMDNGDPSTKVDILIVGDGYTRAEIDKFKSDAKHFNEAMFRTSPFKERKKDFNVRALCVISDESGIDIPDKDVWKKSAFEAQYFVFRSPRYILTTANKAFRDICSQAPYDFVNILVNDNRYGGGGIYQLYTTTYANELNQDQAWQRDYVYVHEFGHSFGGLGDEYYSSSTGYNEFYPEGVEPWEPNVTRLLEPNKVKWQTFVSDGTNLPVDWNKASYDSLGTALGKLDRLATDYYAKREPIFNAQRKILTNPNLQKVVGAFEGAGYVSKGLYRPALDCRMFSLSLVDFDPVCRAAIEKQIDFYSR